MSPPASPAHHAPRYWSDWARIASVALTYFLTAELGLLLPYIGDHITLIWPPIGVAVAALLRWGPWQVIGIFAGALAMMLNHDNSLSLSLLVACGNSLGPLAAALLLRRLRFEQQVETRRDLLLYLTVAVIGSSLLTAGNGTAQLYLHQIIDSHQLLSSLAAWWLGDAMGVLVVGLPLLSFHRRALRPLSQGWHGLELGLLVGITVVSSLLLFFSPLGLQFHDSLRLVPLLLLVWLAIRGSLWLASSCNLLVAIIAVYGHVQLSSGQPDITREIVEAWSYISGLSIIAALVTTLTTEQRTAEARWRTALESSELGVWDYDVSRDRLMISHHAEQLLGFAPGELPRTRQAWLTRVHPDDRSAAERALVDHFKGRSSSYHSVFRLRCKEGKWRWFNIHGKVVERDDRHRASRFIGTIADITAARATDLAIKRAASVFAVSREAIIICAPDGTIVDVNPAFTAITGYSAAQALGANPRLLKSGMHDQPFYHSMWQQLVRDGYWQGEIWNRRHNGEVYVARLVITAVHDDAGQVVNYVGISDDISLQKESEQQIRKLAYYDALTGLPNRTLLRDRAEQLLAWAEREHQLVALLFIDLDHFKTINDSLGHGVGDRLLATMAQRLGGCLREEDTVGRLGGDEFLVLARCDDANGAGHIGQKLLQAVAQPLELDGHQLLLTPSVGVALYPQDGTSFDELLKHADTAMYRAKEQGRNLCHFYAPEMNDDAMARLQLEQELRLAIERQQFSLHFQPQLCLRSNRIIGVEALLRWHHPVLGQIPPGQFIAVAEQTGQIINIGHWVLASALQQLADWRDQGLELTMAVNLSARQLSCPSFPQLVEALLARHQLAAASLELELTESQLVENVHSSREQLVRLRALGVAIAIDDFGTGYSSLAYLKTFPVAKLKIDQTFIHDLLTDNDDLAIASATIDLGHALGLKVIAEGVEAEAQAQRLAELGCDQIQGYWLSRPLPAAALEALLNGAQTRPSLPC